MTRVCLVCKKVIGEKCHICGAPAGVIGWAGRFLRGRLLKADRFRCTNDRCGREFNRGTGGMSHGYCDECAGRRNRELDELFAEGGVIA